MRSGRNPYRPPSSSVSYQLLRTHNEADVSVIRLQIDNQQLLNGCCCCSSPTLYVGEHVHGLYALPSLVGQQSPALTLHKHAQRVLLIEGPNTTDSQTSLIIGESDLLLYHFFEMLTSPFV